MAVSCAHDVGGRVGPVGLVRVQVQVGGSLEEPLVVHRLSLAPRAQLTAARLVPFSQNAVIGSRTCVELWGSSLR